MSGTETAVLRVENADLGYAGTPVLKDVNWTVRPGEFWFLLGPNGSGKSTLLRGLLRVLSPLRGSIWRDPQLGATARIGFVPQHCSVSPALPTTVREFVSLGAIGGDRSVESRAADEAWALEASGLAGRADTDFWSLSGGQRQRAMVARALVRRPSLVVLDEPTEGMDLDAEEAFLATLAELHRSHSATLIFVTHRVEFAVRYATHIALAANGRLAVGTRPEVLRDEVLERAGSWGRALREHLALHRTDGSA